MENDSNERLRAEIEKLRQIQQAIADRHAAAPPRPQPSTLPSKALIVGAAVAVLVTVGAVVVRRAALDVPDAPAAKAPMVLTTATVSRTPAPEREPWMSDSGVDDFGAWASARIADVEFRFRYCPPGEFSMGSPTSEEGRFGDEGPRHKVTLTRGFWLGETEVTQRQWRAISQSQPSHFVGPDLPVESVSARDVDVWISDANARSPALGLRLPTEAEWEYAARAGTEGATYRGGNDDSTLNSIAWYSANSAGSTQTVKRRAPNPWGLHDMLGNVWEWCADGPGTYSGSALVNPSGGDGAERVNRGGSWASDARYARAAVRRSLAPGTRDRYLGFRLARGQ